MIINSLIYYTHDFQVESIVRSRRSADKPHPSPLLDAILGHQTQVDTAAAELAAAGAGETQLTPERGAEVTETSPKFKTPKKKVDDFVFKTPIKTVDGSLTTPIKALGNLLTPVKGITAIEAKDPEPLPSLTTPQKSLLLSPATPVSRHIPASPVLFSPSAARVAVPRTPSSARTTRTSAANRLISEVVQSRRRPLLGPSPG